MLLNTRGPTHGRCNICGEFGKLTEDHTPPKGVIRVGQVELHHIATHLSAIQAPKSRHRQFQNGVKYRTLCAACNNGLGLYDDPALIDFSKTVDRVMRSSWPRSAGYVRPQNLMRSIIGHLSAQGVDRFLKGPSTELMAWYLTDRAVTLPKSIRVFWWAYPYRDNVLVRDAAYLDIPSGYVFSMWLMKFYPLAFMVVFECPEITFHLPELSAYRDCPTDLKALIEIDCTKVQPPRWPEAPSDTSAVLFGEEAAVVRRTMAK